MISLYDYIAHVMPITLTHNQDVLNDQTSARFKWCPTRKPLTIICNLCLIIPAIITIVTGIPLIGQIRSISKNVKPYRPVSAYDEGFFVNWIDLC